MFRRAKLMLADTVDFTTSPGHEQRVVAAVDLTDDRGGPRCARLRPPALMLATAGKDLANANKSCYDLGGTNAAG